MNVLSLFDGISCGRVALDRACIKYNKYYASEIDKYAIKVALKNYPDTIQLGDINNWQSWNLPKIDLLIGGSPCQGFSFAGKQLNFEDPRSKLFFKFVDILNHYKPKYFLLENVKMKKEYEDLISSLLKVKPIRINSNIVSAQNRERLYWTNITSDILIENKHLYLKDIIENNISFDNDCRRIEPSMIKALNDKKCKLIGLNEKAHTCTTKQRRWNNTGFIQDEIGLRYFTTIECERLQTLLDNYTEGISNTQRYKCLGNGWTVDVIAHIFKNIK